MFHILFLHTPQTINMIQLLQTFSLLSPKWVYQAVLVVRKLPANVGDLRDTSSIPGSGRSPGGGHGNSLQYFCLRNLMDRGASWATVHGVTKEHGHDWATELPLLHATHSGFTCELLHTCFFPPICTLLHFRQSSLTTPTNSQEGNWAPPTPTSLYSTEWSPVPCACLQQLLTQDEKTSPAGVT